MRSDQPEQYRSNERAQASVRRIGLIFLAIALVFAYLVWPAGVTELPLSQITLGGYLRILASAGLALAGIASLAMLWN